MGLPNIPAKLQEALTFFPITFHKFASRMSELHHRQTGLPAIGVVRSQRDPALPSFRQRGFRKQGSGLSGAQPGIWSLSSHSPPAPRPPRRAPFCPPDLAARRSAGRRTGESSRAPGARGPARPGPSRWLQSASRLRPAERRRGERRWGS